MTSSVWIDLKYCNLVSSRLDKYKVKQRDPFVANFRCVYCGDSESNAYKTRGYIYQKQDKLVYHCHNCQFSSGFSKFLEFIDASLFKEFKMEKFKEGSNTSLLNSNTTSKFDFTPKFETKVRKTPTSRYSFLQELSDLPEDHLAVKYCKSRKFPDLSRLLYVESTELLEQLHPNYKGRLKENKPRLVIPFYDINGKLFAVSARSLDPNEKLRYITVKIDETMPMIFGLEKLDKTKKTYIVEGPLDSLFLNNSVAVGGTDLKRALNYVEKENTTLIFDNQPRNPQLVSLVSQHLNHNTFLWPETESAKDINDLVLNSNSTDLQSYVESHTYSGLTLRMKFAQWKKV